MIELYILLGLLLYAVVTAMIICKETHGMLKYILAHYTVTESLFSKTIITPTVRYLIMT